MSSGLSIRRPLSSRMTGPSRSDLIAGFENGGTEIEVVDGLNAFKSALQLLGTSRRDSVCGVCLHSNWLLRYIRRSEDRLESCAHPEL